jgi:hypothetical protein
MIPCVLSLPKKFKEFIGFIFDPDRKLDQRLRYTAAQYILALLLVAGRKDCSKLERLYDRGEGSSFRRLLSHAGLYLVGWFDEALERALSGLTLKPGDMLFLAVDITYLAHRGKKRMENLHVFRPDGKKRIRAHALVVSALIIDRIAVPAGFKPFVSESYARKKGLAFKTQMELAIELVREYTPPPGMRVVVLADSGFDCDAFYAQCQRRGFGFVVCLKRNRKLLDPPEVFRQAHPEIGRSGVSLSQYCDWLVKTMIFKKIELFCEEGEGRKKAFYTYREVGDIENVSDQIGEPVNLLFSGRKINNGKQIRVFASNLQSLSAAELSRLYSLRWSIECMFKFLKQELGLGHCQAQSWRAHKQHFGLVFIAYLFLVQQRLEQHGQLRPPSSEKAERRGLYGQLREFRAATGRQQLQPLLRAAESTRPRPGLVQRLRRALERHDAA